MLIDAFQLRIAECSGKEQSSGYDCAASDLASCRFELQVLEIDTVTAAITVTSEKLKALEAAVETADRGLSGFAQGLVGVLASRVLLSGIADWLKEADKLHSNTYGFTCKGLGMYIGDKLTELVQGGVDNVGEFRVYWIAITTKRRTRRK